MINATWRQSCEANESLADLSPLKMHNSASPHPQDAVWKDRFTVSFDESSIGWQRERRWQRSCVDSPEVDEVICVEALDDDDDVQKGVIERVLYGSYTPLSYSKPSPKSWYFSLF